MIDSMSTPVEIAAEAYQKYRQGDPLSDLEVNHGAKVFRRLADDLRTFGPMFQLATNELNYMAVNFEEFARVRKRREH